MNAVVELEGLGVNLAGRKILQDLNVAIAGRSIGLLGPNGAGKTTLIHTLLGFFPVSSGSGKVFGLDVASQTRQIRAMVGYMPEIESFIPGLTAVQLVRFMAELSGLPHSAALERAHESLFYVGLGEARYRKLETFSLGMKQRVKLAQAIVHSPKLIILDEPTNGLDPPARLKMIRLIKEIRDSDEVRLIVSSHLLRDVEECCDDVMVLKQGCLAAYVNLEEERQAHRHFLEVETDTDAATFGKVVDGLGCEWAGAGEGRIKMILAEGVEVRDLYRVAEERNIQIRRLNAKRDSLQDIFMKAMENETHGSL